LFHLADIPLARETARELGEQDYSAADFFEAYTQKIDSRNQTGWTTQACQEARSCMLQALDYFRDPDPDMKRWPHDALRVFAMLAPRHVISGLLWINENLLEQAIQSQRPNKPWAWWYDLGRALLAGESRKTIAERFGLSYQMAKRYSLFLLGPSQPTQLEAA
jgi:hypothetical protein